MNTETITVSVDMVNEYNRMKALVADLEAKAAAQAAKNARRLGEEITSNRLTLRVSEKGAVSVYGLGRFPVTLYHSQLTKLAIAMPEIAAFADRNIARLKVKGAEDAKVEGDVKVETDGNVSSDTPSENELPLQ